jgi:glycosyltransferase involved in cell wall biosynthesis
MIHDLSVVVTSYNCEPYLSDALTSVEKQAVVPGEVVVVHDGVAPERVHETVQEYNVRTSSRVSLVEEQAGGAGAARNIGLNHTSGAQVTFLDGDDQFHPRKLERQVRLLKRLPSSYAFVAGGIHYYDQDRNREWNIRPRPARGRMYHRLVRDDLNVHGNPGSKLYRRSALEEIGGYWEGKHGEDLDLLLHLASRFHLALHEEIVLQKQVRDDSFFLVSPDKFLEQGLRVIRSLEERDASVPRQLIDRRKQKLVFATGKRYLEENGSLKQFARCMLKGFSIAGWPATFNGWLALFASIPWILYEELRSSASASDARSLFSTDT